jgi:hypothetical protein
MPCDYKYQTAFQPTQPATEPKADHVIRCQEPNVATNTSFFRALGDEALLAIALSGLGAHWMLVDPEPLGDGADLSVEILDHRGPEFFIS